MSQPFAPGMMVEVRDEVWRIRRVDQISAKDDALHVIGVSTLVRDKEAIFSTRLETRVQILDPKATTLVHDTSSHYIQAMLSIESQLRRVPPVDARIHVGHKGAMDALPYQLKPAAMALAAPRPRLLIADAVGLGKTLEAGIVLSELIARGRGKRILVVATKSLLTQVQKEMWCRFTIPLTRLDSVGLGRIRQRIPTNHNPFHVFDRAIISIDTLKQNNEYRRYLEDAHWDIIVIDEAHNVAKRGSGRSRSLRNRLAQLLSTRSDTLLMLSATPHDGRAESFASLMNMLDATAIADEQNYSPEEIKALYIRRLKHDVTKDLGGRVPEREFLAPYIAHASLAEEEAYGVFSALSLRTIDGSRSNHLFKTTLEKGLLSSPWACLETVEQRLRKIARHEQADRFGEDARELANFAKVLGRIDASSFSKYQRLLTMLRKDWGYKKPAKDDRLVIFTERIATMNWLAGQLAVDLGLSDKQVQTLHGGMSDVEQQDIVEAFGQEKEPVRLLVASDVASEGINLHYLCHRMVHFDIPWSLMVFQQRNGRIDRYGQEHSPQIGYLITEAKDATLAGDRRILEILIAKDEEVQRNIGDPRILTGLHTQEDEELVVTAAIEARDAALLEAALTKKAPGEEDWLCGGFDLGLGDLVFGDGLHEPSEVEETGQLHVELAGPALSLYPNDYGFLKQAIESMPELELESDDVEERLEFRIPPDLARRLRQLPKELEADRLILTANTDIMQAHIKHARSTELAWPPAHYLWRMHPVFAWVEDRFVTAFGRHSAPVMVLDEGLGPGEQVVLTSGLIPNRKSQPVLHRWFGVRFLDGKFQGIETLASLLERTALGRRRIPNRGSTPDTDAMARDLLPVAVDQVRLKMRELRDELERDMRPKLDAKKHELRTLRDSKLAVQTALPGAQREQAVRRIDHVFHEYERYIVDSWQTEPKAFVQVVAVFVSQE